jgi:hypothetical protein
MLMMNPKRHKRMSAGAMVAVLAGVGTALIAERAEQSQSPAARTVADTLGNAAATAGGTGKFYVALVVGLFALVFGVTAFIRSQNTRS